MRLFIALELPDAWKEGLAQLQQEMREAVTARFGSEVKLRWVRPDGIHLTLKFLGETPESRLESLTNALAQAVPRAPDFDIALHRAGSFDERRAPNVIMATIAVEGRALLDLYERIETWLAAAGWPRERRTFHPHLTLARMTDDIDAATRRALVDVSTQVPIPRVETWRVDRVYLIESHLGPGGARYERLAAFPA